MSAIVEDKIVVNRSEAARLLGYKPTQGRKYIKYLVGQKLLPEIWLPGVDAPRYRLEDLKAIPSDVKGIWPKFN